ncbi:hypothetical protein [Flavobacterium sp.]|uniref:hypothetical protein n=1 Tax=Flavobacterium sp. TaxID=239 RepID=UPI00375274B9
MKNISRLVVIYNNKQTSKNNKNIDIDTNFQNFADDLFLEEKNKEEKSFAKKEEKFISPSIDLVKEYFKFQNFTEFEAERFFN